MKLNTFQAVLASDGSDAYALFLYPANGLQFFGTRPKESYTVQLQLPARVGFCRGEADDLKSEGPYFSVASTEQSVKNLYQLSNLGIPGVWAFHIGSTLPLDNVRPATVGGDLSVAHSSVPLGRSFSHATALESDYNEDNLDYYDVNEEEVDYLPGEPEESLNGRSSIDVSFTSKVDTRPLEGGMSSPDSDVSSPLHPTPTYWPFYPETESATLDSQTKEGTSLGKVETPDLKGQVERWAERRNRSPAPPKIDRDSLVPSWETPPPSPENRSIQPYSDGGPVPSEMDVPPAHPEEEIVLRNYPASGHSTPLSRETYEVGVEDNIGSNTEGYCTEKNVDYFQVMSTLGRKVPATLELCLPRPQNSERLHDELEGGRTPGFQKPHVVALHFRPWDRLQECVLSLTSTLRRIQAGAAANPTLQAPKTIPWAHLQELLIGQIKFANDINEQHLAQKSKACEYPKQHQLV
ncbi:Nidogen-2 [Saguinus oedipus]|uniref:Nidogen-2 n=1 Tax=Saguinus oedipus TaxID=9490 RepID=A0ABQ9V4B4_SAGOE|nr:Nidogen-2 [Saguinus oedipus]